jgi:Velvet factor
MQQQRKQQYSIKLIQQPLTAKVPRANKMCAFGDKDRKTIDPPPVIQLIPHSEDAAIPELTTLSTSISAGSRSPPRYIPLTQRARVPVHDLLMLTVDRGYVDCA